MTGCYSHRVNVWHTIMGRNYMAAERITMPEVFRNAGYRTGHFGKWHLGGHSPYRPMDRGFEEWLGQGDGGTGCMSDYWGNRRVDDVYIHNGRKKRVPGYGPDVFFDAAMDYIAQEDDRPFFVYLATYIPHDPTSIPDPHWADAYRDQIPLKTAYFYSSIERADHNLGRLVDFLRERGLQENTILVFMTDNGTAQGHHVYNAGMRGSKGSVYDGGHRVPCFFSWPAGDLLRGQDIDGLAAHVDLLPTLADLVGLESKEARHGNGMSLAPLLRGEVCDGVGGALAERMLVVESQRIRVPEKYRSFSVMHGTWRLVNGNELYDIAGDPGQAKDLAGAHRERVAAMRAAYEAYWDEVTIGDDRLERPTVGCAAGGEAESPAVVLCAEHLYPDSDDAFVWNQQHVYVGAPIWGEWPILVKRSGRYRLECRRWPEETGAAMRSVPAGGTGGSGLSAGEKARDGTPVDRAKAFLWDEEVDETLYGAQDGGEATAVDVSSVRVSAAGQKVEIPVGDDDLGAACELSLEAGDQSLRAEMLAADGTSLGSVYYMYVRPL